MRAWLCSTHQPATHPGQPFGPRQQVKGQCLPLVRPGAYFHAAPRMLWILIRSLPPQHLSAVPACNHSSVAGPPTRPSHPELHQLLPVGDVPFPQAEERLVTAVRQTLITIAPYCTALGLGDVAAPFDSSLGHVPAADRPGSVVAAAGLLPNACRSAVGANS